MSRELSRIFDELLAMPEFQRLERIRHFQFSIRLLERNADELLHAIDLLTADDASLEIMAVPNRSALHSVLEDVMRRLHNFVAAVSSLIDHARNMTRKLYPSQEFPDYSGEVALRFTNSPLAQFVKDLRQFAQHYKLPSLNFKLLFVQSEGPNLSRGINLSKADLLSFSGWSSQAKQYLEGVDEEIDLGEVVTAYIELVRDFYRWMATRQRELHAHDIAAVDAKKAEGKREMAKDVPQHLEVGLKMLRNGVGDIRSLFASGLSAQDYDRLADAPDDLHWLDRVLAIFIERFGPLPEALVKELRMVAASK